MLSLIPPGRSLKYYALLSWVVSGIVAILTCGLVFAALTYLDFRSHLTRAQDEVVDKSNTVARRISAEMLIGQRGAVQSVSELLKRELDLSSITLASNPPPCSLDTNFSCVVNSAGKVVAYRRVPVVTEPFYVAIANPSPSIWQFVRGQNLLWSALPIALMLAFGLFFQRVMLNRYFLRPIQSLIDTSTGTKEPKPFWPEEIRDISERLYRSFEVRDEEVFSQIARGVVHDLRTLIHTPLAAVDLVLEQKDNPSKRAARLEHLNSVCSQQLPKIKEIIDNTLDGSREISVSKNAKAISTAVDGASKTLETLLKQTGTALKTEGFIEDLVVAHDSIQLERALTNLIKNGIEACQETRGNVQKIVSVSCKTETNRLLIDVEDSGPGLPVSPGRIFRPLKSTKSHGSGLGLIVSRKIIEAHGGRLNAGTSTAHGGAKFTIELPRSPEGVV